MSIIQQIASRLDSYEPKEFGQELPKAGVLVPITRNHVRPEVILTRRSATLSTHSGQVAFPGGKYDLEDQTLVNTALRETHEEVGIDPKSVEVLGELSRIVSLHGLQVNPFVGVVDEGLELKPNPHEIESIFTVPLDYFAEAKPKRRDRMTFKGMALAVPSYEYTFKGNTYEIWGLTAMILVEFLNLTLDANITIFDDYKNKREPDVQLKR